MTVGIVLRRLVLCWVVLSAITIAGSANADEPVVVGVHDAAPLASFDDDGQPVGFAIDVLGAIASSRGWNVRYVKGTWDAQLKATTLGEIDLLIPVDASQERAGGLVFSEESLITSWGQVFAANPRDYENVTKLDGVRVAVVSDDAFGSELLTRLDRFDIDYHVTEFDDVAAAFQGVESGSADVAAVERLAGGLEASGRDLHQTPIVFHPTAARFAAPSDHGAALLAAIDEELIAQKGDPASAYSRAFDRWFAPQGESRIPGWVLGLLGALSGGFLLSLSVVRLYRHRVLAATEQLTVQNRDLQREIAERERAEEQLRHAHKMEALGHLAAGLAHDFNNLLTVIYGYADRMAYSEDELSRESSEAIRAATTRAGKITRRLLAMASRQTLRLTTVDPNLLINDLAPLLRSALRDDIRVTLDLDSDVRSIEVDTSQLQQVLSSLAVNAEDAMPLGGHLTFSTRCIEVGPERGLPNTGPHVEIRIEDTGAGMDPATRAQIFDPFFTTKSQSEGTGLGLAVAYGIIRQCGGEIVVDSALGEGTRFSIVLPAVSGAANSETSPTRRPRAVTIESDLGRHTVLLVDDDNDVRRAIARVLRAEGLEVLAANGAEAALELARHRRDIALIATDVVMPGTRGPALVEKLAALGVDAPVLYISGYAGDDIPVIDASAEFLQKPFTMGELMARARKLLKGDRGSERAPTHAVPKVRLASDSTPLARIKPAAGGSRTRDRG